MDSAASRRPSSKQRKRQRKPETAKPREELVELMDPETGWWVRRLWICVVQWFGCLTLWWQREEMVELMDPETGWWVRRLWICVLQWFGSLTLWWQRISKCIQSKFGFGWLNWKDETDRLADKIASSASLICQLDRRIGLLDSQFQDWQKDRGSDTEETQKLRADVESLRKRIEDADSWSELLKKELGRVQKTSSTLTGSKLQLEKQVKDLTVEVETLKGDLAKANRDIEERKVQYKALKKQQDDTQKDLSELQKKIVRYDYNERLALFRQFGFNLEGEIRETVLQALSEEDRAYFFLDGHRDEAEIDNLDYKRYMKASPSVNTAVLTHHFQGDRRKYTNFVSALWSLKKFSREGAHPTQYRGADVTYEMMRVFIQESDFDEKQKATLMGYTEWLRKNDPYLH